MTLTTEEEVELRGSALTRTSPPPGAGTRQDRGDVGEHPNRMTHERMMEVEQSETNRAELPKDKGAHPLNKRPAARDKQDEESHLLTVTRGWETKQKVPLKGIQWDACKKWMHVKPPGEN